MTTTSRTTRFTIGAALVLAAMLYGVGTRAVASPAENLVAFPDGYRTWTHVKSLWLGPEHALANPFAGLHHIYVNEAGEKALRAGSALPDGTVMVFDLLDATPADHAIAEGKRKLVGVMQKDAKRWAATGGWGFEAFAGDSHTERIVKDGGAGCFACHKSQESHGYVFTTWRQ